MAPGTITVTRAAVLRGTVRRRDGFPIPGVTVTVLNHPEFGQTRTRPDGMFDNVYERETVDSPREEGPPRRPSGKSSRSRRTR